MTNEEFLEPILNRMLELLKPYMKKIYIAGPMSNYPEFNFPAFFKAQKKFEELGYTVFNPADKSNEAELVASDAFVTGNTTQAVAGGFDFGEAYLWDLTKVLEARAIYMLKGWEASPGARGEHAAAVAMKTHYPEYEIIYEA